MKQILSLARLYIASSFFGFNNITVFKFCSSKFFLSCLLNIFDKYKYDNSLFGLKTISCSNLNFASSNFFFII